MEAQPIVRKVSWGVVKYIPGPSLDQCYFYGADDKEEFAIQASEVVTSSVVKLASVETQDKQLPVQPDEYVEFFAKSTSSLADFRNQVYAMALKNQEGVQVTAANEDEPTFATEPHTKLKPQAQPTVAAEAGPTVQSKEGGTQKSPVPSYYQGLSKQVSDQPELAMDLQSTVQENVVLKGVIATQAAELDVAKKEVSDGKKDKELESLKSVLTDLGLVKKPQDWDKYSKLLGDLEEKALGAVETILKDAVKAQDEGEGVPGGGPKLPAKKPAGVPTSPDMPPVSGAGNIMHASAPEVDYGEGNGDLATAWLAYGIRQGNKAIQPAGFQN